MQVQWALQFPSSKQEVALSILIPAPEERPRTIANFLFLCTGELPNTDVLQALRIDASEIAFASPEAARTAGLLPFKDTSVIRVEKDVLVEVGSSTTMTIFGGFTEEEGEVSAATRTRGGRTATAVPPHLRAGTILCSNMGFPRSSGSRYLILLTDVTQPDRAHELAGFRPLGRITGGLALLVSEAGRVAVQPRTLVPLRKVHFTHCSVFLGYRGEEGGDGVPLARPGHGLEASVSPLVGAPRERLAGRTRPREEDEEGERGVDAVAASTAVDRAAGEGFFRFECRYRRRAEKDGRAAKRHRSEGPSLGDDDVPGLHTTAVAQRDGEAFDYFKAQERAFASDMARIQEDQAGRLHRKTVRSAQSRKAVSKRSTSGPASGRHPSTSRTASATAPSSSPKVIQRRY